MSALGGIDTDQGGQPQTQVNSFTLVVRVDALNTCLRNNFNQLSQQMTAKWYRLTDSKLIFVNPLRKSF